MTIYSLDIHLFLFGTSLLFHVQFSLLLLDLHTDFSRDRSGVPVFPTLSEDLLELTHTHKKKDAIFIIGDWNAKAGSQEILGVTGKFSLEVQNEVGQSLSEFWQEKTLVITNAFFQQHKRRFCTWTSLDGKFWNKIDYILCSQRWRSSIESAKIRLGADLTQIINFLLPNLDVNWRK